MNKAKDRAEVLYPILETDKIGNNPYISHNVEQLAKREGYIEGYYQAEIDLELSWEDIREIYCITLNLREHLGASVFGEPFYEEVLKQFKDWKEKKNVKKEN